MTTTQLIALASSPLLPVVVGVAGSIVEKVGLHFELPRMVAFGKLLESVAADIPKFLANLAALAKGAPKDPPVHIVFEKPDGTPNTDGRP